MLSSIVLESQYWNNPLVEEIDAICVVVSEFAFPSQDTPIFEFELMVNWVLKDIKLDFGISDDWYISG